MANSTFPLRWGRKNGFARRLWDAIRNDGAGGMIPSVPWWYTQDIGIADLTAAAVTQEIDLNATFTTNAFPSNCRILDEHVHLITAFAGGGATSVAVECGDNGNDDEAITSTSVFTGVSAGIVTPAYGVKLKAAANDAGPWFEAAYVPTVTITADVNVNTLTAGKLRVAILVEPIAALGA